MNLNEIISLANAKEKEVNKYASMQKNEGAQKNIDNYCEQIASYFVVKYLPLEDVELLNRLKNYICAIGANERHSGHKFYEALYSQLITLDYAKTTENRQDLN